MQMDIASQMPDVTAGYGMYCVSLLDLFCGLHTLLSECSVEIGTHEAPLHVGKAVNGPKHPFIQILEYC